MRSSKLIVILLTFLMLLLVLASAVVFLANRNRDLDRQATELSADREAIELTRSYLESDLAVLESAYESSGATREAITQEFNQTEALLSTAQAEQATAGTPPEDGAGFIHENRVDLVFFSPNDGDVVQPMDSITIYLAARAKEGIDRIEIAIDGEDPVSYPANGLITYTLPVRWEVPSEGNHTISATAVSTSGQKSDTESVQVEAVFQSDEDRNLATYREQLADLNAIRFPETSNGSAVENSDPAEEGYYHLQLLAGWGGYDEPTVFSNTLVLQSFNFIPPGYDLSHFVQAIEGIHLAFDSPSSSRVIDIDTLEDDSAVLRWAGSHDLAHRMQYDSNQIDENDIIALDTDARLALRAMIEGEAALLQYLYLNSDSFSDSERALIEESLDASGPSSLDSLPVFLRQDFEFAYTSGFDFARYLYEAGGFEALDAAWKNPPKSTEHILHPDRYLDNDLPRYQTFDSLLEDVLTDGWQKINEDTFGEFYLREYLDQTLSSEEAEAAASGWGGGIYALYTDEENDSNLLLLLLDWDTPADQEEFEKSFRSFMDQRLGTEGALEDDGGYCWESGDYVCLYDREGKSLILQFSDSISALTYIPSIIVP
jgi:hypothetical protein